MITDAVLGALFGGISALLTLMPSWSFPTTSGGASYLAPLTYAGHIIPIQTAATVFALLLALRVLLAGWDFVLFVYHQFWGSD